MADADPELAALAAEIERLRDETGEIPLSRWRELADIADRMIALSIGSSPVLSGRGGSYYKGVVDKSCLWGFAPSFYQLAPRDLLRIVL